MFTLVMGRRPDKNNLVLSSLSLSLSLSLSRAVGVQDGAGWGSVEMESHGLLEVSLTASTGDVILHYFCVFLPLSPCSAPRVDIETNTFR